MGDILSALIFSPHPETRTSLRNCLEDAFTPSIAVEEIVTLSRAVDRVLSRKPDLAFFDITAGTEEALRTVPSLREGAPETRLVAVYNPLQIPDSLPLSELFLKAMRVWSGESAGHSMLLPRTQAVCVRISPSMR